MGCKEGPESHGVLEYNWFGISLWHTRVSEIGVTAPAEKYFLLLEGFFISFTRGCDRIVHTYDQSYNQAYNP